MSRESPPRPRAQSLEQRSRRQAGSSSAGIQSCPGLWDFDSVGFYSTTSSTVSLSTEPVSFFSNTSPVQRVLQRTTFSSSSTSTSSPPTSSSNRREVQTGSFRSRQPEQSTGSFSMDSHPQHPYQYRPRSPRSPLTPTYPPTPPPAQQYNDGSFSSTPVNRHQSIPISFLIHPAPASPRRTFSSTLSVYPPSPQDSTLNSPSQFSHSQRTLSRHSVTHTPDPDSYPPSTIQGPPYSVQTANPQTRLPRVHSSPAIYSTLELQHLHQNHSARDFSPMQPYPYFRPVNTQRAQCISPLPSSIHVRRNPQESHISQAQHSQEYSHPRLSQSPHEYRQSAPYPPVQYPRVSHHEGSQSMLALRQPEMQYQQLSSHRSIETRQRQPFEREGRYPGEELNLTQSAHLDMVYRSGQLTMPETDTESTSYTKPNSESSMYGYGYAQRGGKITVYDDEDGEDSQEGEENEKEDEDDELDAIIDRIEDGQEEEGNRDSRPVEDQDHKETKTQRPQHQVSVRRTNNPDLKTTKTGKIQHKPKRVGINKRSTAYNRFLQQQSRYLAKHQSHLTPQQRMKRIAEEWAVSEKNPHKTRRKSRFLGPDGELLLPASSSSLSPRMSQRQQEPAVVGPEQSSSV